MARPPRSLPALSLVACLGGGLAAGLVLGLTLGGGRGPEGDAVRAAGPAAERGAPAGLVPAGAATAEAGGGAAPARRAADGPGPAAAAQDPPAEPPTARVRTGRAPSSLVDELRAALSSGLVEEYLQRDEEMLARILLHVYTTTAHPDEALRLLREREELDGDLAGEVARQFVEAGNPALAADALALGLAREPWSEGLTDALVELDPERAVSVLNEAIAQQVPPGAPETRQELARALEAGGRPEEARALALELARAGTLEGQGWELLERLDPAAAEAELRGRLDDDRHGAWRTRLVRLLAAQGRGQEALALVDGLLANEEGRDAGRELLLELDPERGFAYLADAVRGGERDGRLLHEYGDQLLARGDQAGAVDAWFEAFRSIPGDTAWLRQLEQYAPERLTVEFEALVATSTDDELWGDLGDVHLRAGRNQDALRCYERASQIDPGDGEWRMRLQELR